MVNSIDQKPNWFKRFITPPTFDDEEQTRHARLLHIVLVTMLLVFPVYFVAILVVVARAANAAQTPVANIALVGFLNVMAVVMYVLLRKGYLKLPSILFTALLVAAGTFAIYEAGTIRLPAGGAYVVAIAAASLLLGRRTAIAVSVISGLLLLALTLAEINGLLPKTFQVTTIGQWFTYIVIFVLILVLLELSSQSFQDTMTRLHQNERALTLSNRELTEIRASLEQRVEERAAQLSVSTEVARAVGAILDPQELIARVVPLIVERFQYHYAAIFLVDEDGEFAELIEATGAAGQTLKEHGHKLEISGSSMVATAIATQRPRLAQDVGKETLRYANPLLTETRSEVALPLVVGEAAIGALDVQATQAHAFDEGAVAVLQGFASQIAIAINNARQYQAAQIEARQTRALFEASRLAGYLSENLNSIATRLLQTVSAEVQFDSWLAAIYDDQSETLTTISAKEAGKEADTQSGSPIQLDTWINHPLTMAIHTRQAVLITDPERDPRVAHLPHDVRSSLHVVCVPVLLGNRILGGISLGRTSSKVRITRRELQLAEVVAAQLAVAIENRRLLEQSQRSVEELNQLMRLYTREGWADLTQARGESEIWQAYERPDARPLEPEILEQISHSITVGEVKSIGTDGQTVVSVPIALRGEILGSLSIQDNADRAWTSDELTTLQAVADQLAQSLESARLLEESESNLQETQVLYQASRAITAAQTPREILQAIVGIIDAPQIDRCALALIDPTSASNDPVVEIITAWERNNPYPPTVGNRWRTAQVPLIKRQTLEPLVFGNLATATDIDPASRHVFMNIIGAKAVAVIPMSAAGHFTGWVLFEAMQGPYHFTEQEIRRYRTLAGQAAVSLENRRLFQDVEARVNELTILTRIGRRLASSLDLEEILNSVVEEMGHATKAKQASIALYREGEDALEVRVMRGFDPQVEASMLGTLIHSGEGLHGRLLETTETVLVNDVDQEPDYREVVSSTRSELIVPIKQGDLLLGAINLESSQSYAFGDSDVRLIEAMADQMAVAITNARAYEAERQAVERMREVDRLKTQFLANMSHELRTPLNSIIGFSRVMLRGIDGPLTDMQSTDLTSIYNSGQHLLGLINNILDLSKIEAGKMELSIEPVNLVDVAKTVLSTALALVKDKAIKLESDVPQNLPTVMADQTRVRQIILNLVSNAAKFTEKGFIRLRMVSAPKEVLISITDTGIGIPPDKLEHIFEEFTQVDASTTRKYGGTGLGLAITRSFVEMHKGRIWVESEVGVGSTFTFTLPREQEEPEPPVSLPTYQEARGDGKKLIMCVDDDPGVITLYKRYLENQGYVVIGVTDSRKAVEEAKRLLPYAITLDVLMPNQDGWQTLAELKKSPELSNTPILVCSIIQDKTRGFSLGAADYLVKPITEDELLRALNHVYRDKVIHKILVVDDEASAVQLLRRIVESQPGFKVLEAANGGEALSLIQSDKPELILLDLMMPEIDGFAVLEAIKSNPATHDISVIIVTAKEITQEDRERLNGKMVALFNKGMFTADQLLENISQALSGMNTEMAREGKRVEVAHKAA